MFVISTGSPLYKPFGNGAIGRDDALAEVAGFAYNLRKADDTCYEDCEPPPAWTFGRPVVLLKDMVARSRALFFPVPARAYREHMFARQDPRNFGRCRRVEG